ncbi:MAG: hypothetical protein PVSMB11_12440 [Desulfuromonadaceae bacterium]
MNRASAKIVILLMGLVTVLTAGCAQVAHKVDVLYTPLATYRGGNGPLELVVNDKDKSDPSPSIRWVLGQIKNTEGVVTEDIISTIRPHDVLANAFKQELTAAGYQISFSKALDKYTGKGIVFTDISVQLEEVPSLAKLESSCTILLKMDLWKSGAVVKRSEYRSKLSDIAVVDRDQLPGSLFQKAIQEIMYQAVPDIIRNLN